ncbi:WGR domain-containing protein [Streptomyces filamentosus]|uniref:WGR domain-containing protein n=1 Tax=Streptomyces filamentosus TaxID=67294 RepID=UPI003400CB93
MTTGGTVRRWEHAGDGAGKFWEAGAEGASVTVRFGRIGTEGQVRVKEFPTPEAAGAHLLRAVGEKERKGYAPVAGAAAIPPPASAPGAEPAAPAASRASEGPPAAGAAPELPVVRPEETVFTFPEEWKRNLRPRRGGAGPRGDP